MSIWTLAALGLAAGGGYLLGSIPFGLVITKLAGLGDIRTVGSGNIGATNVLRTGNKPLALAVLILDAGKGAIAAALAWMLIGWEFGVIAGVAAFVGHLYPVWLGFKGGKGVATGLGTFLAISWPIFIGMALDLLRVTPRRSQISFDGGGRALLCMPTTGVLSRAHRVGLGSVLTAFFPSRSRGPCRNLPESSFVLTLIGSTPVL